MGVNTENRPVPSERNCDNPDDTSIVLRPMFEVATLIGEAEIVAIEVGLLRDSIADRLSIEESIEDPVSLAENVPELGLETMFDGDCIGDNRDVTKDGSFVEELKDREVEITSKFSCVVAEGA